MENKEKENCIFCKIIGGKIKCAKIYEDKKYFAFLDMNPVTIGHTLVLPKKHKDYIFDLNDKEYKELMLKAKELAKILKLKLKPKRVGLAVEGFGVPHVHVHLIPINKADELNKRRKDRLNPTETELNKLEQKIIGK